MNITHRCIMYYIYTTDITDTNSIVKSLHMYIAIRLSMDHRKVINKIWMAKLLSVVLATWSKFLYGIFQLVQSSGSPCCTIDVIFSVYPAMRRIYMVVRNSNLFQTL